MKTSHIGGYFDRFNNKYQKLRSVSCGRIRIDNGLCLGELFCDQTHCQFFNSHLDKSQCELKTGNSLVSNNSPLQPIVYFVNCNSQEMQLYVMQLEDYRKCIVTPYISILWHTVSGECYLAFLNSY